MITPSLTKTSKALTLAIACLISTNVAAKPVQLSKYEKYETIEWRSKKAKKETIRATKVHDQKAKVIVSHFKDDKIPNGSSLGAAKSAEGALVNVLSGANVEIIDRDLAKNLESELKMIELQGESMGSNFNIADFAFKGDITSIGISEKWEYGKYKKNAFTGQSEPIPPVCRVTANAKLTLNLYDMNPLQLNTAMPLEGKANHNYEHISSCGEANKTGVILAAIQDAIGDAHKKIKNMFSSKGRVYERHVIRKGDKIKRNIFRTTIKANSSNRKGLVVEVYDTYTVENELTNKTETKRKLIASGVSIEVEGDDLWFKVNNKLAAEEIKKGDIVEVVHKCPPLDVICKTKAVAQQIQ